MTICACGKCGLQTTPGRKFRAGHHTRIKPPMTPEQYKEAGKRVAEYNRVNGISAETRARMSNTRRERIKDGTIKMPLGVLPPPRSSKWQRVLAEIISALLPGEDVVLEHRVWTSRTYRFIDIAVPGRKLGIEYDGANFHTDPAEDAARDAELCEAGWKIVHIREGDPLMAECIRARLPI